MAGEQEKRRLIAMVHVARKELGLDDDAYRDVLGRVTGVRSCSDCTRGQLEDVITEMKRLGFRVRAGRRRTETSAAVRKIFALWRAMAPRLRSEGSDASLRAFVKRVAGVDAAEFLDDAAAARVIEALKAWERRLVLRQGN